MLKKGKKYVCLLLALIMTVISVPLTGLAEVVTEPESIVVKVGETAVIDVTLDLGEQKFVKMGSGTDKPVAWECFKAAEAYCEITATRTGSFTGESVKSIQVKVKGVSAVSELEVEIIVPAANNDSGADLPVGSIFITVEDDGSGGSGVPVLKGIIMEPEFLEMEVGEVETLDVTATPSDATMPEINWSSSNSDVAEIDPTGFVSAIKAGTATITATAKTEQGVFKAVCKVNVTGEVPEEPVKVEGITLSETEVELMAGTSHTLSYTITPENATNKTVVWSSSEPSVAIVNNGTVTGIAEGTSMITVTTESGEISDFCTVTVKPMGDDTAFLVFPKKGKLDALLIAAGFDPAQGGNENLKHIYITTGDEVDSKIEFAAKDMQFLTANYKNLESFVIEEGSRVGFKNNTLPNGSFQGLKKLKKVVLPDVQVIGARAFGYVNGTAGSVEELACSALEEAEFGAVYSIGCGAFYGCESLASLTFNGISIPPNLEEDAEFPGEYAYWFEAVPVGTILYVPTRAIPTFRGEENEAGEAEPTEWDRFIILSNGDDSEEVQEEAGTEEVIIEDLGGKKLNAHTAITSEYGQGKKPFSTIGYLTIEAGTMSSADFTFIKNSLTGLKELRIIGTTTLPSATFDDYSAVPDMEAADAAAIAREHAKEYDNVIPSNAFGMMKFLQYVEITNAEVVGNQAFQKVESLEEVVLPNVKRVNSMAFAMVKGSDKSKLSRIILPSLEYMEHRTFYFNVNLKYLELGEKAPFVYRPQGKEGLWFSFVAGPVTISVPDRAAYDDFMAEDNCMYIDWSSFDFEARNGDELPVIEKAPPYVDSDLDYLREKWQSEEEYYTGDIPISLNFYTFNVNLNAWRDGKASPPQLSTLDAMRWAKEAGFDAADITAYYIPGYSNTAMPTEEQKEEILEFAKQIRELSEELELPISGTGLQNNFADPSQKRRDLDVERIKYWTDIAAVMGAPCVRIFSGTPPADVGRNGWYKVMDERIVPAIQEVADYAAEKYPDIMIGLQNHGDMLATANQVLYALDKIDRDNVRIVNDTGYYHDFMDLNSASIESYDWYSDIAQILPYSTNFQVKKKPAGAGTGPLMDLERIFTDIRNSSYRGYVPLELLWVATEEGYPNNLDTPPYEETEGFLQKVRAAVEKTKTTSPRCDVKEIVFPANGVVDEDGLIIAAKVDRNMSELKPYLSVSAGATWKLYADEACTEELGSLMLTQDVTTAYVRVTAQNGDQKIYLMEVRKEEAGVPEVIPASSVRVSLDKELLYYNTSDNMTRAEAFVAPEDASGYVIAWETSDPTVAVITGTGKEAYVTGVTAGDAVITAVVINQDGTLVKGSNAVSVAKKSSSGGSSSSSTSTYVKSSDKGMIGEWKLDEKGWWFKKSDGSYAVSEWGMINNKWYYFDETGYMKTGWLLNNNTWYFLNAEGDMAENTWVYAGERWYYLNAGGSMAANSWILSGDKWYYVGADGSMFVSAVTPDGYQVDENGVWIP